MKNLLGKFWKWYERHKALNIGIASALQESEASPGTEAGGIFLRYVFGEASSLGSSRLAESKRVIPECLRLG